MSKYVVHLMLIVTGLVLGLSSAVAQNADCEPGFRLFDHELLATDPVCVPEAPERIVAMDRFTYETLLALGIEPIAGTNFALGIKDNLPYLMPQVEAAASIGDTTAINFERLLELSPDLIFTLEAYDATAELSLIAPTVSFAAGGSGRWREIAAATALAVNAEERLSAIEANYEQRLEVLQATLNVPDTFEIAVVRPGDNGLLLPMQNLFLHTILENVELSLPVAWEEFRGETGYATISIERLDVVDADVMLIWWFTADPQADEALAAYVSELEQNPLWRTLEVVQAENVHVVGSYWIGSSYHAAHAVIDDLFRFVAGTDPAEVSPNPFLHATSTETDSVFPVTVEHKFGTTTITQAPQRVVAIGYTEQDFLLALGVQPVAVRYWYGEEDAILPWAEDLVTGEAPVVLNMPFGSLNYEAILALQPDLISAVTAGISEEEYATLSQIAPTVAQSGEYIDFGMPWQVVMQMVGDAVGKSAEAEAIVAETEALFAEALADNPQFKGKTVAVAYSYGDTYGFYTAQDSRARFFTDLGFVVPDELVEIAGESFYADISLERFDLLDQDLIAIVNLQFIEGGRATLEADPLFGQLRAVREGRVLYLDETAENALGFSSPLSLRYALEAALPQLEAMFPPEAASACEPGFRPITHAMGETCVPENPQRVVVLDTGELDNALALGASIVGAPTTDALQYQEYLNDQLNGIADIGAISTPNLEAILALSPDLILGSKQRYEAIYEQLSEIAPTVFTESLRVPWQTNFALHAEALNRSAQAQVLLATYDVRIAEVQAALGDALDTTTISVIRFRPGQVRLYLKSSYIGYILQDVGLPRPASQDEDRFSAEISLEDVQAVDADYIFITGYAQDDSDLATFLNSPLWQTLSAVQNGRALDVDDDTWIAGLGVQSALLVLDDLERLLSADAP